MHISPSLLAFAFSHPINPRLELIRRPLETSVEHAFPHAHAHLPALRDAAAAVRNGSSDSRLSEAVAHLYSGAALEVAHALAHGARAEGAVARPPASGGRERLQAALGSHSREHVATALSTIELRPTFTAHPTEMRPPQSVELLGALGDHVDHLAAMPRGTKSARRFAKGELNEKVKTLAKQPIVPTARPGVYDEAKSLVAQLTRSVLPGLLDSYEHIEAATREKFGDAAPAVRSGMRFNSWVAADRDGNGRVTAEATRESARHMRRSILEDYMRDLGGLAREPGPHRVLVSDLQRRVRLTLEREGGGFESPAAFHAALGPLKAELATKGDATGAAQVHRLMRKVDVAGFHLATLEWRQASEKVIGAFGELRHLAAPDSVPLESLHPMHKLDSLTATTLASSEALLTPAHRERLSPEHRELVDSLHVLREIRADSGKDAVGSLIIANSEQSAHILALTRLAKDAGVFEAGPLSVTPLFETIGALTNAPQICHELLENPAFREHVKANGDKWEIMLGYSDSAKDGGRLAADIGIERAQKKIATVLEGHGVTPRFFHGRGGSLGRGAATPEEAIALQPSGIDNGHLKFTEQGEVIANRYGRRSLAADRFDGAYAALIGTVHARPEPVDADHEAMLDRLARDGADSYHGLVRHPDFAQTFFKLTAVRELGALPISSREAKRAGQAAEFASLRAVPYNFAWNQLEVPAGAFYGTGTALKKELARSGGPERLQRAYQTKASFRAIMDRTEHAVIRTNLRTARRSADRLWRDPGVALSSQAEAQARAGANRFVDSLATEHRATAESLALVTGRPVPTTAGADVSHGVDGDILNELQLHSLESLRARSGSPDRLRAIVEATIAGKAAFQGVTG